MVDKLRFKLTFLTLSKHGRIWKLKNIS